MRVNALIPTRFMLLVAHLIITIVLFSSIDENIRSCLPVDSQSEVPTRKTEFIVGLSLSIGFIAIELIGFITGVTMFIATQDIISIFAHCSAAISLSFFIFESWPCGWFWWIFAFCSALPAVTELLAVLGFMLSWNL